MKKSQLMDLALLLAYKAVLDIAFIWCIFPIYSYEEQYKNNGTVNSTKVALGYAIVFICMMLFKVIKKEAVVSRFVVFIQMILIVVPYTVLFGAEDLPAWHVELIMLGFFCLIATVRIVPTIRIKSPKVVIRGAIMGLMVAIVMYVYVGLIATGGLGHLNLNFDDVYENRDIYAKNMLPGFGYFVSWTAYIFNMTLLVAIMRTKFKSRVTAMLGIALVFLLQLTIFAMTNFKAFLFVPFAVVGLIILSRRMEVQRAALIGAPLAVGMLVALNFVGIKFGAAMLDRMFFVPAALHGMFFDYFSTHPLALMGGTTLGDFLGSTYTQSSVYVVANEYWGTTFSPNVGWMGDGYANFGIFGIVFSAMVLAVVLKIADGFVSRAIRPGMVEGLMVGPSLALCSAALGTTLLTHGMVVALIVLWVLKGHWDTGDDTRIISKLVVHGETA